MASASDHRAHAALQPADCLILLPQRLPAAVETSIGPAHYPAECTQSDAFLQPSLRARKGRANSNSFLARTLYESFDAKARAHMTPGVGEEWDACLVAADGAHVVGDEAKALIGKVWATANRSPFDIIDSDVSVPGFPENWQQALGEHIRGCLKSQKQTTWTVRTPTMIIR